MIAQTWTLVRRQGRSEAAVRLLAALDLESGRERWTAMPGGELLAIEGGEAWMRVRTVDTQLESVNFVAGIDVATGRQLWRHDLPADWPEECVAVGRRLFTTTRKAQKDRSKVYTGDRQGAKLLAGGWIGSTVTSSLVVQDVRSGRELGRTALLPATQMSAPVPGDGFVYVSTIAEMAEGRSGVFAFEVPR